jgi:hypothetical protein
MTTGSITEQHHEELLSLAYVTTVASQAGLLFNPTNAHDYGIDGHLDELFKLDGRLWPKGHVIQVQLKACVNATIGASEVSHKLDTGTFNYLVTRADTSAKSVPCVLILLCLPNDRTQWVAFSEDHLLMRKCCYWAKFKGQTLADTKNTKTVKIPRTNQLTPEALRKFFDEFEQGTF